MHETNDHPNLIPRALLFGSPERANPKISPDGKKLAYLAEANGLLSIWVKTLDKDDDVVLTKDVDAGWYRFSPDGSQILYLRDNNGDENYHLIGVNIATKEVRDYTPLKV